MDTNGTTNLSRDNIKPSRHRLPHMTTRRRIFHNFQIMRVKIIRTRRCITIFRRILRETTITNIIPTFNSSLRTRQRNNITRFLRRRFTITIVRGTSTTHLQRSRPNRTRLPLRQQVTPWRARIAKLRVTRTLPHLRTTSTRRRHNQTLAFLRAPIRTQQIRRGRTHTTKRITQHQRTIRYLGARIITKTRHSRNLGRELRTKTILDTNRRGFRNAHQRANGRAASSRTRRTRRLTGN